MKRRNREMGGFTLMELMIVLLVIGILVAIAVPVFLSARASAERRTCQANLRTIDGAANAFAMESGGIYPTEQDWYVNPLYIKGNPKCPRRGIPYFWVATETEHRIYCMDDEVEDHEYP